MIGPADGEGEESFDFDVCSPAWLSAELERYPILSGRFLLIADDFHPKKIEEYVLKRVAQADGPGLVNYCW